MRRPELNEVDLEERKTSCAVMTVRPGQWDKILDAAYVAGWLLVEIDKQGAPVKAYRRKLTS